MLDINKIHELSLGVDQHIRSLLAYTDLLKEIRDSLKAIEENQKHQFVNELNQLQDDVADLSKQLRLRGLPESSRYEREVEKIKELSQSNDWPTAVDQDAICTTPEQEQQRAAGIMDMFVNEYLKDLRFLDYGCGTGYTIPEAFRREAKIAIGYDVKKTWTMENQPTAWFTTDFKHMQESAPFDVVLVYDVLDHSVMDPIATLRQIRSLVKRGSHVYVRCHPWCSRHGSHLYRQINKAFLHLVVDEVELTRMGGHIQDHTIKLNKPLDTYKFWFSKSGFSVKTELPIRTAVQPFFKTSIIHDRIKKHWDDGDAIEEHMSIDFVDYLLEPSDIDYLI